MKHNEKYHLWLGRYDSMEEYDKYIDIDGTTQTSQLAIDLGFPYRDKELDEVYGLTCLQPDFRYSFPLSEGILGGFCKGLYHEFCQIFLDTSRR